MDEETKVFLGTVIFFSARKGFGFLDWEGEEGDLFVHFSNIQSDGFKTLLPDQRVEFEIGENHKGRQAVNVRVIAGPDEDLTEE